MKLDKIGIWSEIKLDIIKEYANAFTKIMKSQEWCKGYVYIDSKGGPLFFLFFASHNETGKKIVTDIFNKHRKYL